MKRLVFLFVLALLAAVAAVSAMSSAASSATRAPMGRAAVENKFPAAGELTGNSVTVRRTPNSKGRVIKVMKYFRPDFRVQEILAVSRRTGSDGGYWYRISVPMRPN